jgi:hypothetical protein
MRCIPLLMLMGAITCSPALRADAEEGAAANPWNVAVGPPAGDSQHRPQGAIRFSFQAFEDLEAPGPAGSRRGSEAGIAVTADLARCENDSVLITAIDVGGWTFDIDGRCPAAPQAAPSAPPSGARSTDAGPATNPRSRSEKIVCGPVPWNCRPIPAR